MSFNIMLKTPINAIKQEKVYRKEEMKLCLFKGDMMVYVENIKESINQSMKKKPQKTKKNETRITHEIISLLFQSCRMKG